MELLQTKYKDEAIELIEAIEKSLLLMGNDLNDPALIEEVFRNMHTLKGNSSMFGFKLIADFTHHLESLYELIRTGEIKTSKQILNISFAALDHLASLVNSSGTLTETEHKVHHHLSEKIITIICSVTGNDSEKDIRAKEKITKTCLKTWRIDFRPDKSFFLNASDPFFIIDELHQFGECEVVASTENIPLLEDCEFNLCYTSWDILLTTEKDIHQIHKLFEFVQHKCKMEITEVLQKPSLEHPASEAVPISKFNNAEGSNEEIITPSQIKNVQNHIQKKQVISSIRVPSERLDNLMNLVSELMTLQAKLGTLSEQNSHTDLLALSENLEKISTRLRDNAFSMCLVPLEHVITPLHRLVRDLASDLNKDIEFIADGTDTELDKNIMEGLSDPLMHLIRNSIDHGIEDTETRMRLGKPKNGKILFSAYRSGTHVYIEIEDDGQGIDPEKIRRKAIEKGLISADDNLGDKDILNMIFLPGFSTATRVSEISGRGVGMDVVKRKIADIRGQIKIKSAVNIGTTITIRLPITVSIIDGLLVKINHADYVIPLSAVERCYEISNDSQLNRFNNIIVLDGEQIPFINLSEEFDGIENSLLSREIVIIYYDEKKVGLIVDNVVGKFQAVLKPLGKYFLQMDNISGATILGNGNIALVLDTNNVTEQFLNKKSVYSC
ncbi:MAG: chemotaxis protein CheA [Ginsengibacter sp.]